MNKKLWPAARSSERTVLFKGQYGIAILDERARETHISESGVVALPAGSKFLMRTTQPETEVHLLSFFIDSKLVYTYPVISGAGVTLIPHDAFRLPESGAVSCLISVLFTPQAKITLPDDRELVEPCWDKTKSQFMHLWIKTT